MEQPTLEQDSGAWIAFTQIAFVLALIGMVIGIWLLPVDLWVRGYLAMGFFFVVSSTITLCKTTRDNHEARKLINRVSAAKTEKLLHDYDLKG